jgi:hypothetical protein
MEIKRRRKAEGKDRARKTSSVQQLYRTHLHLVLNTGNAWNFSSAPLYVPMKGESKSATSFPLFFPSLGLMAV